MILQASLPNILERNLSLSYLNGCREQKKRKHSNSCVKTSITWISKPDKEGRKKENYRLGSLKRIVVKVLNNPPGLVRVP